MAPRTQPKAASQKDKAAFRSTLNRALADLGAQKLGPDEWLLETQGGAMRFVIFEDWAGARFEDIEKAQAKLPKSIRSEMNPMTGQWNTHFGPAANAAAANDLAALVSTLLHAPNPPKRKPTKKVAAKRNPARPRRNAGSDGDTFSQIEEHVQDFLQSLDAKIAEHRRLAGSQEMHLRTTPQDLDARESKATHDDSIRTIGKLRAEVVDAMEQYDFDKLAKLGAVPADLVERHMDKVAEGMRNPARAKPCGCQGARHEGGEREKRYKYLEALAQRASATGDKAGAAKNRLLATKVLKQANAAGEAWATPPKRNPALQTPLEECCGGAKRNPATDASFADFDWPVIARLLHGHLQTQADDSVTIILERKPRTGKVLAIVDEGGQLGLALDGKRTGKVLYTSPAMRVGNVTLGYRIQATLDGQAFDDQLDLDRDMPDSNAIPPKVRELEAKVRAENPDYSVGQARATAWSIFCKHVDPTSQHCKKLRHQYFAIKGGKGSQGYGKIRVARIELTTNQESEYAGPVRIEARPNADVWKEADRVLTEWARKLIPADRIEEVESFFEIQWSDGRKYRGSYELSQDDRRGADLSQHVSDALQVFAGKHKPAGMSPKDYARIVRQYGEDALGFIAKYDLGPSADDLDEVVKDMPKVSTKKPSEPVAVILPGKHPAAANSTKRSAKKPSKKGRVVASSKRAALSIDSPAFQAYLSKLRKQHSTRVLEAEDLKKYIRVSWKISPTSSSRSILLFVDKDTGNVHQAESWKRPKAVLMGNIFEGQ